VLKVAVVRNENIFSSLLMDIRAFKPNTVYNTIADFQIE
jgi:hypothetical protein